MTLAVKRRNYADGNSHGLDRNDVSTATGRGATATGTRTVRAARPDDRDQVINDTDGDGTNSVIDIARP
jgi:hypothetical protein